MKLDVDTSNIEKYVGTVGGIIEAIGSNTFKGDFQDSLVSDLKKKFRTDAIAAHNHPNLKHVFEWGESQGESSTIPLFRLTSAGRGGQKTMSFYFAPSVKPVPLPDPGRYGFSPNKLQYLRRHVFKYKALVMETQATVTIAPRNGKALFIPSAASPRGYFMTPKAVTINPGGAEATGGFTEFWRTWFDTEGVAIAKEKSALTEQFIAKTGQRVMRNNIGRFSSGKKVGVGYVDAAKRTAELEVIRASKEWFDEDGDYEE